MLKINKNIVIEDSNIKLESLVPVTLYDGSGQTGNVSLNDNVNNYKYIEIFYDIAQTKSSIKIDNRSTITKFGLNHIDSQNDTIRFFFSNYTISNTTLFPELKGHSYIIKSPIQMDIYTDTNYFSIYKVIGYK